MTLLQDARQRFIDIGKATCQEEPEILDQWFLLLGTLAVGQSKLSKAIDTNRATDLSKELVADFNRLVSECIDDESVDRLDLTATHAAMASAVDFVGLMAAICERSLRVMTAAASGEPLDDEDSRVASLAARDARDLMARDREDEA